MTRGRFRTLLIVATVMAVAVVGVFASLIVDSQRQARRDLEKRFRDRATVSAALTQALFGISATATQGQAATRLGGRRVDPRALANLARTSQWRYAQVLDAQGHRLAATAGAPPAPAPGSPHLGPALAGRPMLSNMLPAPGGGQRTVEWAVPYDTRYGRRVELVGLREPLIAAFLRSFLGQVPSFGSSARSVVVDAEGNVVGSAQSRTRVGGVLADRALRTALRTRRHGDYRRAGSDWFFTSAPVAGSPWRVVLASSQEDLYASVNGSRRTVPWVVFATMVMALAAGLLLLRRVATATAEIERRELNQRHAVEINDNVLQRLTVARYAMERGDDDVGREKLLETMREAQALINRLLGERDVEPGELRRQAGAGEASPGAERPQDAPRTFT